MDKDAQEIQIIAVTQEKKPIINILIVKVYIIIIYLFMISLDDSINILLFERIQKILLKKIKF